MIQRHGILLRPLLFLISLLELLLLLLLRLLLRRVGLGCSRRQGNGIEELRSDRRRDAAWVLPAGARGMLHGQCGCKPVKMRSVYRVVLAQTSVSGETRESSACRSRHGAVQRLRVDERWEVEGSRRRQDRGDGYLPNRRLWSRRRRNL